MVTQFLLLAILRSIAAVPGAEAVRNVQSLLVYTLSATALAVVDSHLLFAVELVVLERCSGVSALRRSFNLLRAHRARSFGVLSTCAFLFVALAIGLIALVHRNSVVQPLGEWMISRTSDLRAGFFAADILLVLIVTPLAWVVFVLTTVASVELWRESVPTPLRVEPVEHLREKRRWPVWVLPAAFATVALVAVGAIQWRRHHPTQATPVAHRAEPRPAPGSPAPSFSPPALHDWQTALESPDATVRRDAAEEAALFGPESHEAVPPLLHALSDSDPAVRRLAAKALVDLIAPEDRTALGPLRGALADSDAYVRKSAVLAVTRLSGGADAVRDDLRSLEKDPERAVREAAEDAVVQMGGPAEEIAPILVRHLSSGTASEREDAMTRLVGMGALAVPLLEAHVMDSSAAARDLALKAMTQIGAPAAPALARALRCDDAGMRSQAADALIKLGVGASDALPVLRELVLEPRPPSSNPPAPEPLQAQGLQSGPPYGPFAFPTAVPLGTHFVQRTMGPFAMPMGMAGMAQPVLSPRAAALRVLAGFGEPALPGLVEMLNVAEPATAAEILGALGTMQQRALPALPTVLAMAREGSTPRGTAALRAALMIDPNNPDLVKILIEQLRGADRSQRVTALSLVLFLGPARAEAIPDIVKILASGPVEEQVEAAHVLSQIGAARPETVPALRNALRSRQPRVTNAAVIGLSRMGAQAAPAVDDLARLALKSPDPNTRVTALMAIGSLGPAGRRALPTVIRALHDPDTRIRQTAVTVAGRLGPGHDVVAALTEALKDSDDAICGQAAQVLGQFGAEAASAAQALGAAMMRTCNGRSVAQALLAMGPASQGAIPGVLKALEIGPAWAQGDAADVLGGIGAGRPETIPALCRALRGPDPGVAGRAALALLALHAAAPALDDLVSFVETPLDTKAGALTGSSLGALMKAREAVVTAIGDLGPAGVPALIRLTHSRDATVRLNAVEALGKLGPASEVTAALSEALTDQLSVCTRAAQRLGKLGQAAASAVPAMGAAVSKSVCGTEIVKALDAIGPASVPALEAAAQSSNYATRTLAESVLKKMGKSAPAPPAARAP
jgi:HEAT repeat protein